MIFADMHIHSKYSRATSNVMDIKNLSKYGAMKGLNIIGTGDITHPKWQEEVKNETEYLGNGIYKSKYNEMRFMLSSEISTIYSQDDLVRRVHHILLFKDFEQVNQFTDELKNRLLKRGKKCNLTSDGRPIIGMSSIELSEIFFNISNKGLLIPAHIWTPWFSLFGSKSGFNKIEDCYQEYSKKILAVETGLSSDPLMNWRLNNISDKVLVSNSDCHGPFVDRIGRECNAFKGEVSEFSYDKLYDSLKNKEMEFTVEVDPSYGKYHFDGHRNCNICFTPKQTIEHNKICPVCHKPLTVGVLSRVEELADEPEGYTPQNKIPFEYHIPLIEIISKLVGKGINTKIVHGLYEPLIKKYNNEFNIMFNVPIDEINSSMKGLGNVVQQLRNKTLKVKPGYDGVYGEPLIAQETPQKKLIDL